MKTRYFIRLLAIVGVAALIAPYGRLCAEPTPQDRGELVLSFIFNLPEDMIHDTIEGVFTAEGAFKDSGKASETFWIVDVDGQMKGHGIKILKGRRGLLVIEFEANLYEGGAFGDAVWHISYGTGAYRKIRGGGEGWVKLDPLDPAQPPTALIAEYYGEVTKYPGKK